MALKSGGAGNIELSANDATASGSWIGQTLHTSYSLQTFKGRGNIDFYMLLMNLSLRSINLPEHERSRRAEQVVSKRSSRLEDKVGWAEYASKRKSPGWIWPLLGCSSTFGQRAPNKKNPDVCNCGHDIIVDSQLFLFLPAGKTCWGFRLCIAATDGPLCVVCCNRIVYATISPVPKLLLALDGCFMDQWDPFFIEGLFDHGKSHRSDPVRQRIVVIDREKPCALSLGNKSIIMARKGCGSGNPTKCCDTPDPLTVIPDVLWTMVWPIETGRYRSCHRSLADRTWCVEVSGCR